jgi:predicted nucleic acid-binding protein
LIYLMDTNTITDLIEGYQQVTLTLSQKIIEEHTIGLCPPVYYEVMRGLQWKNLLRKQAVFQNSILPQLDWIPFVEDEWDQAIQFWVSAKSKGRQLSDMDVLLAAIAQRLNTVIVSSDTDFDALPVQRENWRNPAP